MIVKFDNDCELFNPEHAELHLSHSVVRGHHFVAAHPRAPKPRTDDW